MLPSDFKVSANLTPCLLCLIVETVNLLSSGYLVYRVAQKSKPQSFVHIFVKYWPIVKILSLAHSAENL